MTTLTYIKGDVTKPQGEGPVVLPHVCNDIGAWGAGVSGAIGKKFPAAEANYRDRHWYRLGEVDFVRINDFDQVTIANMVAQHGIKPAHQPGTWMEAEGGQAIIRPPIRYYALAECMEEVRAFCYADSKPWCSIHAPRFAAGLAGADWRTVEALILEIWVDNGIDVTVYDLP